MRRTPKLLATALLSLSLVLSACGGGQTSGSGQQGNTQQPTEQQSTTQQPAGKEKVTIRLATWAGADEAKELQAVIDKINAEATDYQIVHEPAPADYYTKVQTMFAGGTAPDLLWLSQEYVVPYASKGALMDLTDRLAKDSRPAADLDDYFPLVLEHAQYEGRTYGLPWIGQPWIGQPCIVYYNEQLFDDAGLPYPTDDWTWEEFYNLAKQLTNKEKGIYGTTFNGWPPVQMFIWQAGGEVISPDLKSSPIDSPEAIKGLEFYSSIIYNEEVAPSMATINEQGFGEMFKAGKIAMYFGGAADDLDRVEGLRVGTVKVPKGPKDQTNFAWTASTVINAKTKYPDQAYEALIALTEGIHHWKIVPPRKSLATKEQIIANEPRKEKAADTIVAAAQEMRAYRIVPRHTEWDTIFWEQMQDPLYSGKGTAADLAKQARAALEEVLPR